MKIQFNPELTESNKPSMESQTFPDAWPKPPTPPPVITEAPAIDFGAIKVPNVTPIPVPQPPSQVFMYHVPEFPAADGTPVYEVYHDPPVPGPFEPDLHAHLRNQSTAVQSVPSSNTRCSGANAANTEIILNELRSQKAKREEENYTSVLQQQRRQVDIEYQMTKCRINMEDFAREMVQDQRNQSYYAEREMYKYQEQQEAFQARQERELKKQNEKRDEEMAKLKEKIEMKALEELEKKTEKAIMNLMTGIKVSPTEKYEAWIAKRNAEDRMNRIQNQSPTAKDTAVNKMKRNFMSRFWFNIRNVTGIVGTNKVTREAHQMVKEFGCERIILNEGQAKETEKEKSKNREQDGNPDSKENDSQSKSSDKTSQAPGVSTNKEGTKADPASQQRASNSISEPADDQFKWHPAAEKFLLMLYSRIVDCNAYKETEGPQKVYFLRNSLFWQFKEVYTVCPKPDQLVAKATSLINQNQYFHLLAEQGSLAPKTSDTATLLQTSSSSVATKNNSENCNQKVVRSEFEWTDESVMHGIQLLTTVDRSGSTAEFQGRLIRAFKLKYPNFQLQPKSLHGFLVKMREEITKRQNVEGLALGDNPNTESRVPPGISSSSSQSGSGFPWTDEASKTALRIFHSIKQSLVYKNIRSERRREMMLKANFYREFIDLYEKHPTEKELCDKVLEYDRIDNQERQMAIERFTKMLTDVQYCIKLNENENRIVNSLDWGTIIISGDGHSPGLTIIELRTLANHEMLECSVIDYCCRMLLRKFSTSSNTTIFLGTQTLRYERNIVTNTGKWIEPCMKTELLPGQTVQEPSDFDVTFEEVTDKTTSIYHNLQFCLHYVLVKYIKVDNQNWEYQVLDPLDDFHKDELDKGLRVMEKLLKIRFQKIGMPGVKFERVEPNIKIRGGDGTDCGVGVISAFDRELQENGAPNIHERDFHMPLNNYRMEKVIDLLRENVVGNLIIRKCSNNPSRIKDFIIEVSNRMSKEAAVTAKDTWNEIVESPEYLQLKSTHQRSDYLSRKLWSTFIKRCKDCPWGQSQLFNHCLTTLGCKIPDLENPPLPENFGSVGMALDQNKGIAEKCDIDQIISNSLLGNPRKKKFRWTDEAIKFGVSLLELKRSDEKVCDFKPRLKELFQKNYSFNGHPNTLYAKLLSCRLDAEKMDTLSSDAASPSTRKKFIWTEEAVKCGASIIINLVEKRLGTKQFHELVLSEFKLKYPDYTGEGKSLVKQLRNKSNTLNLGHRCRTNEKIHELSVDSTENFDFLDFSGSESAFETCKDTFSDVASTEHSCPGGTCSTNGDDKTNSKNSSFLWSEEAINHGLKILNSKKRMEGKMVFMRRLKDEFTDLFDYGGTDLSLYVQLCRFRKQRKEASNEDVSKEFSEMEVDGENETVEHGNFVWTTEARNNVVDVWLAIVKGNPEDNKSRNFKDTLFARFKLKYPEYNKTPKQLYGYAYKYAAAKVKETIDAELWTTDNRRHLLHAITLAKKAHRAARDENRNFQLPGYVLNEFRKRVPTFPKSKRFDDIVLNKINEYDPLIPEPKINWEKEPPLDGIDRVGNVKKDDFKDYLKFIQLGEKHSRLPLYDSMCSNCGFLFFREGGPNANSYKLVKEPIGGACLALSLFPEGVELPPHRSPRNLYIVCKMCSKNPNLHRMYAVMPNGQLPIDIPPEIKALNPQEIKQLALCGIFSNVINFQGAQRRIFEKRQGHVNIGQRRDSDYFSLFGLYYNTKLEETIDHDRMKTAVKWMHKNNFLYDEFFSTYETIFRYLENTLNTDVQAHHITLSKGALEDFVGEDKEGMMIPAKDMKIEQSVNPDDHLVGFRHPRPKPPNTQVRKARDMVHVRYNDPNLEAYGFPKLFPYGYGSWRSESSKGPEKNATQFSAQDVEDEDALLAEGGSQRSPEMLKSLDPKAMKNHDPSAFGPGLKPQTYVKWRLLSPDSRWRDDRSFSFFWLDRLIKQRLYYYNFQARTVQKNDLAEALTAREVRTKENYYGSVVPTTIPGSKGYWASKTLDIIAMTNELGPPDLFITLTQNDNWPELQKAAGFDVTLRNPKEFYDRPPLNNESIVNYPVEATIAYHRRLALFKDQCMTLGKMGPFGVPTDYFARTEYQGRGALHHHILLWIKKDTMPADAVTAEMPRYVGDDKDLKRLTKTAREYVEAYQIHRCMPSKCHRIKNGVYSKKCKYGFPFHTNELQEPEEKGLRYRYKRTCQEDLNIVPYNLKATLLWQGHTNVQFVTPGNIERYIAKYVTKAEVSTRAKVGASDGDNYTNFRVVGACECATTELQFHQCKSTRKVLRLPTEFKPRFKMLKRKAHLPQDNDSEDVFYNDLFEKYLQRPKELDHLKYPDYVRHYRIGGKEPARKTKLGVSGSDDSDSESQLDSDGLPTDCGESQKLKLPLCLKDQKGRTIVRRRRTAIPRWKFLVPFLHDSEKYFEQKLATEVPLTANDLNKDGLPFSASNASSTFAEECVIRKIIDTEVEASKIITSAIAQGFSSDRVLQIAQDLVKNEWLIEDQANEILAPWFETLPDFDVAKIGEMNDSFQDDVINLHEDIPDYKTIEEYKNTSTESQRRAIEWVERKIRSREQILAIVTGDAGSGKSYTLKALVELFRHHKFLTKVVCPNGAAAILVNGTTIHQLLRMNVELESFLQHGTITAMMFQDTKTLFIDEFGQMSYELLEALDIICRKFIDETGDASLPFGGRHIIFFGDPCQLPSIGESIFCHKLLLRFKSLVLKEIVRQEDTVFAGMLSRFRRGKVGENDEEYLAKCRIDKDAIDLTDDSIFVVPTNDLKRQWNKFFLDKLSGEEHRYTATYTYEGKPVDGQSHDAILRFCKNKYEDVLLFKMGCRVILKRNLPSLGKWANGTPATVVGISKSYIMIQSLDKTSTIPITRVAQVLKFGDTDNNAGRYIQLQFPLDLGYATTVHSIQGRTVTGNLFIDLYCNFWESGMIYVALSRVKKIENLRLLGLKLTQVRTHEAFLRILNHLIMVDELQDNPPKNPLSFPLIPRNSLSKQGLYLLPENTKDAESTNKIKSQDAKTGPTNNPPRKNPEEPNISMFDDYRKRFLGFMSKISDASIPHEVKLQESLWLGNFVYGGCQRLLKNTRQQSKHNQVQAVRNLLVDLRPKLLAIRSIIVKTSAQYFNSVTHKPDIMSTKQLPPAFIKENCAIQTAGDGNCLFRSISTALFGSEEYYGLIKLITSEEILFSGSKLWNSFFANDPSFSLVSFQLGMIKDGVFCGNNHAYAISKVIQRPIYWYGKFPDSKFIKEAPMEELQSSSITRLGQKRLSAARNPHWKIIFDNSDAAQSPVMFQYRPESKHFVSILPRSSLSRSIIPWEDNFKDVPFTDMIEFRRHLKPDQEFCSPPSGANEVNSDGKIYSDSDSSGLTGRSVNKNGQSAKITELLETVTLNTVIVRGHLDVPYSGWLGVTDLFSIAHSGAWWTSFVVNVACSYIWKRANDNASVFVPSLLCTYGTEQRRFGSGGRQRSPVGPKWLCADYPGILKNVTPETQVVYHPLLLNDHFVLGKYEKIGMSKWRTTIFDPQGNYNADLANQGVQRVQRIISEHLHIPYNCNDWARMENVKLPGGNGHDCGPGVVWGFQKQMGWQLQTIADSETSLKEYRSSVLLSLLRKSEIGNTIIESNRDANEVRRFIINLYHKACHSPPESEKLLDRKTLRNNTQEDVSTPRQSSKLQEEAAANPQKKTAGRILSTLLRPLKHQPFQSKKVPLSKTPKTRSQEIEMPLRNAEDYYNALNEFCTDVDDLSPTDSARKLKELRSFFSSNKLEMRGLSSLVQTQDLVLHTSSEATCTISERILPTSILETHVPVQITGDGNCFYRCIAKILFGEEFGYKLIKLMLGNELIYASCATWSAFRTANNLPFDSFAFKAIKEGEWANKQSAFALSKILRRPICILKMPEMNETQKATESQLKNGSELLLFDDCYTGQPPIVVHFMPASGFGDANHYTLLMPKNKDSKILKVFNEPFKKYRNDSSSKDIGTESFISSQGGGFQPRPTMSREKSIRPLKRKSSVTTTIQSSRIISSFDGRRTHFTTKCLKIRKRTIARSSASKRKLTTATEQLRKVKRSRSVVEEIAETFSNCSISNLGFPLALHNLCQYIENLHM